jgi:DNA primase
MWMKSYKNYKKLTPIETIQLVKDSMGIEAVLEYYAGISLENVKGQKTKLISCFFRQERTPSLAITSLKNVFHCFGCQAKGDIVTLASELKNVTQARAAYLIAEDFSLLNKSNMKLTQDIKRKTAEIELKREFPQKEVLYFLMDFRNTIRANTKARIKRIEDMNRFEKV